MDTLAKHMIFHGSVVLLLALLLGAPYARSINRQADALVVNAWRVAHQSLVMGALVLFGLAGVLPTLAVSPWLKTALAGLFVVSAYAFVVSTPLAAITKDRGLAPGSKGLAGLVYVGNMLGAVTSLLGAALLLLASAISLT